MKIVVHTQGIVGSRPKREGEQAGGMFRCVLEIDGMLIDRVTRVRVDHRSDEFTYVVAVLIPGEVEEVVHTQESWDALFKRETAPA